MADIFDSNVELTRIRENFTFLDSSSSDTFDRDEQIQHFEESTLFGISDGRPRTESVLPSVIEPLNVGNTEASQYIRGTALFTLIVGLTMAAFLLMIDSTILVTVSPT